MDGVTETTLFLAAADDKPNPIEGTVVPCPEKKRVVDSDFLHHRIELTGIVMDVVDAALALYCYIASTGHKSFSTTDENNLGWFEVG